MIVDIEVSVEPDGDVTFLRKGMVAPPSTTRPLKVIVCGGRDFGDYVLGRAVLGALNLKVVIHGAARGADTPAARAAKELEIGGQNERNRSFRHRVGI